MQPKSSSTSDPFATRASLLERACAAPEGEAWNELLGYYEPFVLRVLRSLGFRDPELSDLRQEVFLKLWKGLELYKRDTNRAKFRTWFSRLIRNAAADHVKAMKRRNIELQVGDGSWASVEDSKLMELIESEWRRHVVQIAMERVRSVFSGRALEVCLLTLQNHSTEEIAERLKLKRNTVYILRHRVKKRLMQEIKLVKQQLEIPYADRVDG